MDAEAVGALWTNAMVRACWQSTLAFALVWLTCRTLLRKSGPATRATLWWFACLKTVLAFAVGFTIAVPIFSAERSPFTEVQNRLDLLAPNIQGSTPPASTVQSPRSTTPVAESGAEHSNPRSISFSAVGMTVWLMGVIGVAIWTGRQAVKVRSILKTARPLDAAPLGEEARRMGAALGLDFRPRVAESASVTAPMVVGLLQPVVLVPSKFADDLSADELRMAMAHELAHIRRRDLVVGVIPSLCQILFFFFPPIWIALREWSLEREAACDAEALAATSGTPNGYGRMLMKIVTRDHQGGLSPVLGATASYHTLKKRLEMIKSFTLPGRFAKIAAITFVGAGLLLALPWQLTARAATGDAENLIKNSGFEAGGGFENWLAGSLPPNADTGVDISIDSSTAHTGKASLKLVKTRQSFFPVGLISQYIPYDGNSSKIKVSLWAKAEGARKATMAVMFDTPEGSIEWGAYIGEANPGDSPANHDWKKYGAVLAIPQGAKGITIALEMYGPGTVWLDDISAAYAPASTPLQPAIVMAGEKEVDPLADVKDVPNADLKAGKDPMKRYFMIGPKPGPQPAAGYKLLLVMPGGDGSADFNPFIRRLWKNALPEEYVVAELVAPKWASDQFELLVWPTHKNKFNGMKFSTEDFVEAVVADVSKKVKIDPSKVFTLSWSSGGPAAYATGLSHGSVKGSFIAMSIFHPNELPPLFEAKGLPFYILHSPDDTLIPISQARTAADDLKKAGAITKFVSYPGGHGWHGDVFGSIREGVSWLESPKAN